MIAVIALCLLAAAPAPASDLPPPVCISRAAAEACYTCHAERAALLAELQAVPVVVRPAPTPSLPWWSLPLAGASGIGAGIIIGIFIR